MRPRDEYEWTYNGTPDTDDRDAVRDLIGDTNAGKKLLFDPEIDVELTRWVNVYFAAAACCEKLAARTAPEATISAAGMSEAHSTKSSQWRAMATRYWKLGKLEAKPVATGQAVTEKIEADTDSDAVQPKFRLDMDSALGGRTIWAQGEQP